MNKRFMIVIFMCFSLIMIHAAPEERTAIVSFSAQAGVDIGFSFAAMNNNIMPPTFGPTDQIELTLNNNVWASSNFYLHARVYTREKISINISTDALREYNLDLGEGSLSVGVVPEGSSLAWTNTANKTNNTEDPVFKKSVKEKKNETLIDENTVDIETNFPRYYSWPFKMQVDKSDAVEGKYYQTEFKVYVQGDV